MFFVDEEDITGGEVVCIGDVDNDLATCCLLSCGCAFPVSLSDI